MNNLLLIVVSCGSLLLILTLLLLLVLSHRREVTTMDRLLLMSQTQNQSLVNLVMSRDAMTYRELQSATRPIVPSSKTADPLSSDRIDDIEDEREIKPVDVENL